MSAARALGWNKQPDDDRDHDAMKAVILRVTATPESASNADLTKVVDQGGLGSCTANGSGQAVRAAEILMQSGGEAAAIQLAQTATPFWSRLFAYYLARAYEGTVKQDAGANIRDIFKAINKFGFCAESALPYNDNSDPENGPTPFSQMPPAEAFREAYDQRQSAENVQANVIDYALIRETGTARVDAIKLAISQRHLVVFGTLVTNGFCSDMSANGGRPISAPSLAPASDIAGGHCMAIGSYDAEGAGIVNSWSTQFGQRGWCKFAWDYIMWNRTTDLWVVRRAPLLLKAT